MAIIRIARGCKGKCSYCAIRFATGKLKSKPLDICKIEYQSILERGYKKIIINAEDTGAYGLDIGITFSDLLIGLSSITPSNEIKWDIQTLSPQYALKYRDIFLELIKKGIISRIKCDIQSGNRRILQLMNRYSDVEKIISLLDDFRKTGPVNLTSQFIVGFPSETQHEFYDTVELMKILKLTSYEVFPYSDRENTVSSMMSGKLSDVIIEQRMEYLKREFFSTDYDIVGDAHKVYLNRKG